jgi:hypothetical protein
LVKIAARPMITLRPGNLPSTDFFNIRSPQVMAIGGRKLLSGSWGKFS